jgi:hypothetical protein
MKSFHFTPLRTFIVALVFVAGVIAVVLGVKYAHRARERRLQALFVGPCEVVESAVQPYYPRCDYDLREYASGISEYPALEAETEVPFPAKPKPRDIEWVDGAAREQLETMIRERRTADAVTGATAVLRLRSPTVYRARQPSQLLRISYPPNGAVFPPNLCEPCVEWEDGANNLWQVTVGISDTSQRWSFIAHQRRWWFPRKLWLIIQKEAVERDAWIQIKGVRQRAEGGIQASKPVHFRISRWPADNAIVYRLVAPPFVSSKTIASTATHSLLRQAQAERWVFKVAIWLVVVAMSCLFTSGCMTLTRNEGLSFNCRLIFR